MLKCCNKEVKCEEIWFLKDIKGFGARKLYAGKCPHCKDDVALLVEKRTDDGKIFCNNLTKIEAVKALYREKKRIKKVFKGVKSTFLYDWIYGQNVEIKNKHGKVIQIRQYSSNFKGQRIPVRTYHF